MPSWIATKDVSTGDYFDVQRWNNVVSPYGSLSYFQNLVNAKNDSIQVTQSSQSITANVFNTVNWSSATIPNTNMWTTGSDITFPSVGIYLITVELRFLTSTAGVRYSKADYSDNNGASFSNLNTDAYVQPITTLHTIFWYTIRNRVSVGGKFRLSVYQTSGGNNALTANLTVQKLGDLYDY